jgi:hypothetical protein
MAALISMMIYAAQASPAQAISAIYYITIEAPPI